MTEKEERAKRYSCDVQVQESHVRQARVEMDEGYKKLQADLEISYAKLKGEYERQLLELEKEKLAAERAKDEMEKGFEA